MRYYVVTRDNLDLMERRTRKRCHFVNGRFCRGHNDREPLEEHDTVVMLTTWDYIWPMLVVMVPTAAAITITLLSV